MSERFNGPYIIRYLQPEESVNLWLVDNEDQYPGKVEPKQGVIYVDSDHSHISFICPCNGTHLDGDCSKYVTHIPVDGTRGWVFQDSNGVPSISPSIFRSPHANGCHYFIRNGMVEWA